MSHEANEREISYRGLHSIDIHWLERTQLTPFLLAKELLFPAEQTVDTDFSCLSQSTGTFCSLTLSRYEYKSLLLTS